jgi:hypothetical protein
MKCSKFVFWLAIGIKDTAPSFICILLAVVAIAPRRGTEKQRVILIRDSQICGSNCH